MRHRVGTDRPEGWLTGRERQARIVLPLRTWTDGQPRVTFLAPPDGAQRLTRATKLSRRYKAQASNWSPIEHRAMTRRSTS